MADSGAPEVLTAIPRDEVARRCERAKVSWAPIGQPGDLLPTSISWQPAGSLTCSFHISAAVTAKSRPTRVALGVRPRPPAARLRLQPPRIGEHNTEVLGKAGFSSNEIAQL